MTSLSRVFTRSYSAVMAAAKSNVADTTAAVKKPVVKRTAAKKTAAKVSTGPKKLTGILKPMPISPVLSEFVGAPESSRTEAVKKVWEYIKANNLQNPANKREIFCDEKLKTVLDGKAQVEFLEIAKLLSKHFVKAS
ncbi:Upstream activation factor subunit UAF30 [Heracleum sosnowskyi]|uniref:Upstream activation factor subunit UAF30 n=1 Tax=Heracleum sosnowskyi TaxID=360622 RepID=A0AAD8HI60_9APIA|nr:Upstream activation factor subunit UAF30 [Heracleum sosnowskyi]